MLCQGLTVLIAAICPQHHMHWHDGVSGLLPQASCQRHRFAAAICFKLRHVHADCNTAWLMAECADWAVRLITRRCFFSCANR